MGETLQLAAFAAEWNLRRCPQPVLAQARRCILDTLGCALGGADTALTRTAAGAARRMAEAGPATVIGLGRRAAPDRAAFLNGISANALDFDGGIVRQGHYGPTIVPSALAMAELVGASGAQLLEAVIVGYEVVTRVNLAVRASAERHRLVSGYGPYQGFGSVAAAGHLLGLDRERMVHAFGLYGAFAPVPSTKACNWEQRPLSWTKDMVAWPSMAGINAALLAEAGFLGPRSIFEGDKGFFRMAGSDQYRPELLVEGLGEQFNLPGVYFKPYPCCRWHHAALDGLGAILRRRAWGPAEVAQVRIGVAQEVMEDLHDAHPHNLVDAEFSMPYVVALTLLGLAPGPGWHDPALLRAPQVRAHMDKVALYPDAGLDTLFNQDSIVGARVEVHGADGSLEQARVECAHGDASNPMSDADLEAKFRTLAAGHLPAAGAETCIQMIGDLERLERAATLAELLA